MDLAASDPAPVSQAGLIDASTTAEATPVLHDVLQWQLTEPRWAEVAKVLTAMAAAVSAGDPQALLDATAELEVLSPVRVARLGATLVGPAPQKVRLLRNQLVHDLGIEEDTDIAPVEQQQASVPTPPPAEAPGAPASALVAQQELVIHMFAALDGPQAERGYEQLRRLWEGCRNRFAATEPVPHLGLPTELPADLMLVPATPVIAAVQSASASVQAILRRDHDVLNLSVLCAAMAGPDSVGWSASDRDWDAVAAGGTDALLGVARLYLGLAPASAAPLLTTAALARTLVPQPPPGADDDWPDHGTVVAGCAVWELSRLEDTRAERRIIVLADADGDDRLSAWTWTRGDALMTPYTQYLMHAAKLRYETRIRERAAAALQTPPDDRADPGRLTGTITRLKDIRVTAKVARQNMATLLGPADRAGFVEDDDSLAEWLLGQLDADLTYLDNARERTKSGVRRDARPGPAHAIAQPPTPTFGLVTALAEEFTAMRTLIADPTPHPVADDRAGYVIGTMPSADPQSPHRVVLTLLGETSNDAAAEAVAQMLRSFASVDQVVMVGVAAGIPNPDHPDRHVRLGDIVAATWGVIAYDHVVDTPHGPQPRQEFPRPSALLAHRAKMLEADELLGHRPWEALLDTITTTVPAFDRPAADTDRLFAGDNPQAAELAHPDLARSGHRPGRPKIHYGRIGSADRSIRNAATRDAIAQRHAVRAIEMEGKGTGTAAFASGREWFVVRGISDYADSHLNHDWRRYASATAAAYTAALLAQCPPIGVHGGHNYGAPAS